MTAYVESWVRFERLHLDCKFLGIRPKIVRIQPCDVLALAVFKCFVVVALYSNVFATFQHPDYVGVTLPVGMRNAESVVCRTVICDDYFDRESRLLIDGAVNGSR